MKRFSDFLEGRCWPGYKPKPGKTPYSPGSCVKEEDMAEEWSQKYKSSINCSHPKGFSQRAHCAGKKKHNESVEMEMVCEDCGMCETHGNIMEIAKGAKDSNGYTKCWPGKHAEGTKKGKNGGQVRNCVPNESQGVAEGSLNELSKDTLKSYAKKAVPDMQASQKKSEIEAGKAASTKDDKTAKTHYDAAKQAKDKTEKRMAGISGAIKRVTNQGVAEGVDELSRILDLSGLVLTADEQFDIIESMVEALAEAHGVDSEQIWEDFESVDDHELLDESAAWHRSAGKSKKGGLNAKGVASYRREHPGSKLQMAVTTKPSKLKPGSKAAKRRKSFCARMGGVDGPMKKPNGKPTRKALALRKWNC